MCSNSNGCMGSIAATLYKSIYLVPNRVVKMAVPYTSMLIMWMLIKGGQCWWPFYIQQIFRSALIRKA